MVNLNSKDKKNKRNFDEYVTRWMGSVPSIIIHTILFIVFLASPFFGYDLQNALLVLTTVVSLEAIYLSLFIQISINRQSAVIDEVSEDIEDIQEDVEDIQEDVEEIQEDVEEVSKDVEELSEDVENIHDDIHENEKEEESEEQKEEHRKTDQKMRLEKMEKLLENLLNDISKLKQ